MSKVRFDGLDVTAMAAYLESNFTGRRVVNIYDGGGESYIFKLDGTDGAKPFLLLESGIRFHTLTHFQAPNPMPSPFAAKLRKHLRGLRLEHVQQIGSDRVVLLHFGAGSSRHSLILELYAKGNLILTDKDYTVLALLRSHIYQTTKEADTTVDNDPTTTSKNTDKAANPVIAKKNEGVAVQVGQVFPVSYATTLETTESEKVEKVVTSQTTANQFSIWAVPHLRRQATSVTTKKKKQSGFTLKTLLLENHESGVSHYGPGLIEHCIRMAGLEPNINLVNVLQKAEENATSEDDTNTIPLLFNEEEWGCLKDALLNEGPRILEMLGRADDSSAGYILYKLTDDARPVSDDSLPHADKILLEFQPVLLQQHDDRPCIVYDNFAAAVEDYFDHLQHQKILLKAAAAEKAAVVRLEKVRGDQEERLLALENQQEILQHQAKTVQLHAENVDKALAVINSALDSGMDWDQLEKVVEMEQIQNQNPIALLIHKLHLDKDGMVLRLPTTMTTIDTEADVPTVDVHISLKESAHANANRLFAHYRSSKDKSQKTVEASAKALKAAETTAKKQLEDAKKRSKQTASIPGGQRRTLWFEKFHWFVTSDNYLAIAGRDAHQNELLVKRYLRPGDAYLHADVHGSTSCILRAKRRRRDGGTEVLPLSEQALREAGNFTICRSSAWTSRMVTSAYWVESHQVSKTAPTGEFLTLGSFMIRGKKNFLPPTSLEMGLAVLFVLGDEDSLIRHKNERRDFAILGESDDVIDKKVDVSDKNDNESEDYIALLNGHDGTVENIMDLNGITTHENHLNDSPLLNHDVAEETNEGDDEQSNIDSGDDDNNTLNHFSNIVKEHDVADDDVDESMEKKHDDVDGTTTQKIDCNVDSNQKRGLSARDRRLIKKYGSLEAAEKVLAEREANNVLETSAPSSELSPEQQSLKRGKKAKQKKMNEKYADQDEEDRKLAMLALQGGTQVETKKKNAGSRPKPKFSEKQQEVAAETVALLGKDTSMVANRLSDEVRLMLSECVTVHCAVDGRDDIRWEKFDADTIEQLLSLEPEDAQVAAARRLLELKRSTRIDNFSASLGGIIRTIRKHGFKDLNHNENEDSTTKRKSKLDSLKEQLQWKQTMEEEGIVEDEEDDAVDDTIELSKLTGKPQVEDLLLFAIPVSAPYQTLSQYTYRVKLTPGNMKRGKAAKQCVDMFLKNTEKNDRQIDLIKRVGDNDWVQSICGDVKIASAGASKLVKQSKAKNRKSKTIK